MAPNVTHVGQLDCYEQSLNITKYALDQPYAEGVMTPGYEGWHLNEVWPGLEADRDGVMYDAQLLGNVADAMWKALPTLTGVRFVPHETLEKSTDGNHPFPSNLGSQPDVAKVRENLEIFANHLLELDEWDGGLSFAAALRQSHDSLNKAYLELNQRLEIAFELISAGAGNYIRANAANTANGI
jgi:hypothetical protein